MREIPLADFDCSDSDGNRVGSEDLVDLLISKSGEPGTHDDDSPDDLEQAGRFLLARKYSHFPREYLIAGADGKKLVPDWDRVIQDAGLPEECADAFFWRYVVGANRAGLLGTAETDKERRALQASWRRVGADRDLPKIGAVLRGENRQRPDRSKFSVRRKPRAKPKFVTAAEALAKLAEKRENAVTIKS